MKLVMSFGFKYGRPKQNEFEAVYDVRHFKNPHSNPKLRDLDGRNEAVQKAVLSDPNVEQFIAAIVGLNYRTVAIGCMGGKHRSVVIAEEIAKRCNAQVVHRDIKRR